MLDLSSASTSFQDRFWNKVDKRTPDECWPWKASVDKRGYGKFSIARSVWTAASRVAYALTVGPIPDGAYICHTCDDPGCCNPAHLWLGTAIDNNADKMTKGRFRVGRHDGEYNPRARLTEQDVVSIRQRVSAGETRVAIAREYGVSNGTIDHAVKGISWKHVVSQ